MGVQHNCIIVKYWVSRSLKTFAFERTPLAFATRSVVNFVAPKFEVSQRYTLDENVHGTCAENSIEWFTFIHSCWCCRRHWLCVAPCSEPTSGCLGLSIEKYFINDENWTDFPIAVDRLGRIFVWEKIGTEKKKHFRKEDYSFDVITVQYYKPMGIEFDSHFPSLSLSLSVYRFCSLIFIGKFYFLLERRLKSQ